MGRRPCCSTLELKKGHWTSQEDKILVDYVRIHGEGKWRDLAQKTGTSNFVSFASFWKFE